MTKINTVANNGLTIVENYNKLLEQFRKTKTIDDVRILVASAKDFISVYKRVDKNMVNEIYDKLQSKLQDMVAENAFVYDRMNNRVEEIRNRGYDYANEKDDNMMIELYASMAQVEIEKREKRQREGIEQKKARGEWDDYGRPRVMDLEEFATHYRLVQQGKKKPFELMRELGMTKPTFYRYKNQIEKGC